MKFDSKLKGGLAWAGLFVVLAVPSANVLLGQPTAANALTPTSDMSAVKTDPAPIKLDTAKADPAPATVPAITPAADPVQTASVEKPPVKLTTGKAKAMPDYITEDPVAATPAATTPAAQPAATEVATTEEPPVPLPRSARPKSVAVASIAPAEPEKPLVLTDKEVADANKPVEPFPMSDGGQPNSDDTASTDESDQPIVTGDQLQAWKSGSLAEYLDKEGLMSPNKTTTRAKATSDSYDADGFFLDEGPNSDRRQRPQRDFFLF